MAQTQYDSILGGRDADVVVSAGSSITTSAVRVTIDDSNCKKKEDALQQLNYIMNRIKEGNWPPA